GAWGVISRRPLESATRTLPLMAVLFIVIALNIRKIYPWTTPEHPLPYPKWLYLNPMWFEIRAIAYFAIWLLLMLVLNYWSKQRDRVAAELPEGTPIPTNLDRRSRAVSGPGLILCGLTITFASIDWVMSLEPDWFSSIFGVLMAVGQMVSALSFG